MRGLSSGSQISFTYRAHAGAMDQTADVAPVDDRIPMLADPAVPATDLLGDGAAEIVATVVEPLGAEVERIRPTGTSYYPGRSLLVEHEVSVRWADGKRTKETVVLGAGRTPPEGALTVSDGTHDIVVWRGTADPWLPGYGPAMDPAVVGPLLADLGYPAVDVRTKLRAYRPGKRAVVEVTGEGLRAFLKVVRPHTAEALHERHQRLAGPVPVPASMGWSEEHGIVVLQALPGRTVRQVLQTSGSLPGPKALTGLLDALPDPGDDDDRGAMWRGEEFADHIATILPPVGDRVAALAGGMAPFEAEARATPTVGVHGDFYEAQVLTDGGRVVGLLDVDTFGAGRRVDDLATYVGHLVVLATTDPRREARINAHALKLLAGFDREVDPALLRAGIAGVILGLATGSFRVLESRWQVHTEHRIALAEQWLASADAARNG